MASEWGDSVLGLWVPARGEPPITPLPPDISVLPTCGPGATLRFARHESPAVRGMNTSTGNAMKDLLQRRGLEIAQLVRYGSGRKVARIAGQLGTKTFTSDTNNLQVQLPRGLVGCNASATKGHDACTPVCNPAPPRLLSLKRHPCPSPPRIRAGVTGGQG